MDNYFPTISVLMSVYKEPIDWIRQSVDSVLTQTFDRFELIIICDNPDYTEAVSLLREYKEHDSRVIVIYNPENIGLTKSLNEGLKIAKGEFVARLDADDISLPTRLERQLSFMRVHPEVVVLGTNISFIGEKTFFRQRPVIYLNDRDIKAQLLLQNGFVHSSVFIRKKVLDQHNIIYDEDYRQTQDLRLWEMLFPLGEFANLRDKLVLYRISDQQITKSSGKGQINNALKIRHRLQMAWLNQLGYKYSECDLENRSSEILTQLKLREDIKKTPEFKAFLRYVYLYESNCSLISLIIKLFVRGDWRYLSTMDLFRVLRRSISI